MSWNDLERAGTTWKKLELPETSWKKVESHVTNHSIISCVKMIPDVIKKNWKIK